MFEIFYSKNDDVFILNGFIVSFKLSLDLFLYLEVDVPDLVWDSCKALIGVTGLSSLAAFKNGF